jgi:hypothetical protein
MYFRIERAQQLLPEIEPDLREAISLYQFLKDAEQQLEAAARRVAMLGGALPAANGLLTKRGRRDALASRLRESLDSIQERGCVVRDLDTGLVDFPTLFRGEEVCLCWQLGEERIAFWHGAEEGFAGRKAIDREFLEEHAGEEE